MSKEDKIKICTLPKNFRAAHNHTTHVVVVSKQETSEEDKILKKIIKEDYKFVFKDLIIIRNDEINKKDFDKKFRGRTITAVEFRTLLPIESYKKLAVIGCSMNSEIDRMKKRVEENKKG